MTAGWAGLWAGVWFCLYSTSSVSPLRGWGCEIGFIVESERFSWMRTCLLRWLWKAGWMEYSFQPVMYFCVCVAAFLFSYHTHEQPHQSPDPADSHAPVLLWTSSRLWHYWLHPWHAHVGFHGSRGETAQACWVWYPQMDLWKLSDHLLNSFILWPLLYPKATNSTFNSALCTQKSSYICSWSSVW